MSTNSILQKILKEILHIGEEGKKTILIKTQKVRGGEIFQAK
jgi:hypothetical protein